MGLIGNLENEKMVEALGDILVSLEVLKEDEKLVELAQKQNLFKLAIHLCKNYSKEVVDIMATLEGTPREEYKLTIPKVIKTLKEIQSDDDLMAFFSPSSQTEQ